MSNGNGAPRVGVYLADGTDARYSDDWAGASHFVIPSGTGSTTFASETEAEAGTSATTVISPLTLHAVIQHLEATASDIDAGTADRLVTADRLLVVTHALRAAIDAKHGDADVLRVALAAVDAADLTAQEKAAFRTRIGSLQPEGEWSATTELPDLLAGQSGAMQAVQLRGGVAYTFPVGITEARIAYDGDIRTNQFVATFSVDELLALPDLPAGGGLAANLAGRVLTRTVTGTAEPFSVEVYFGHIGRALWFGTEQTRDQVGDDGLFSLLAQTRTAGIEFFALSNRTDQVPLAKVPRLTDAKMPSGWERFDTAEQSKLAAIPATTDKWPTPPDYADIPDAPARFDPATVPESDQADGNDVLVVQRSGRKDAILRLADVSGSWFWGAGRGSTTSVPMAATAAWNAVVHAIRWRPGTRLLTVWVTGAQWSRLYLAGVSYSVTEEGNQRVPWDTSGTSYRQASVTLSADAATYLTNDASGDKAFNLRDPQSGDYVVGNPFVREARLPIDEVTAPDVPAVRAIPPVAQRAVGDQWRLLVDLGAVAQVGELVWDGSRFPDAEIPDPITIYAPASGTFAGRLSVDRGSDTRTWTSIEIDDTSYPLTPGGEQFPHLFTTAAGAVNLVAGREYDVNVVSSTAVKLWADIQVDMGDVVAWDGHQLVKTEDVHTSEDVFDAIDAYQQDHGEFVTSTSGVTDIVVLTESAFQALVTAGTVDAETLYLRT